MGQFHFTPERYLELMHEEVPRYDELQERTAAATAGTGVRRILELGTGTGETTRRVLAMHARATVVGIDASEAMLAVARGIVGPALDARVARLEEELPEGPFDLVVSALAVHHLDAAAKQDLFSRVAAVVRPGGRFVLADVVVPVDSDDAVTPLNDGFDLPDSAADQLAWLRASGFTAHLAWAEQDLAILVGALA